VLERTRRRVELEGPMGHHAGTGPAAALVFGEKHVVAVEPPEAEVSGGRAGPRRLGSGHLDVDGHRLSWRDVGRPGPGARIYRCGMTEATPGLQAAGSRRAQAVDESLEWRGRSTMKCRGLFSPGSQPTGRSGQGEDLRAVAVDEDGVLHLRRAEPVGR